MKNVQKFLEFNGTRLSVLSADGEWWIAIKPICEALDVDYVRQFKNLQDDDFFAGALSKQTMHDASNRLQQMTCIREKEVYGWLCSIRSESPALKEYKRTCYDILYNHFHGALTGRITALNQKSATELRMIELQEKLNQRMLDTDEYREMQELKAQKKQIAQTLNNLDVELLKGQLSLAFSQ